VNSLLFPLSRYKFITVVLILLSAALIVGQTFLTDANPVYLWCNWAVGGVFAVVLWYVMGRFHLGGVSEGKALAITWPLMSMAQNFAYLYFNPTFPYYHGLLQLLALMAIITLILSTWQSEQSPARCIGIGMLIGLTATLFPRTILWLVLMPFIMFHMRSASIRNVLSTFTGALLGIWIDYFLIFSFLSPSEADQIILQFLHIFDMINYADILSGLTLGQCLFLALLAILVIVYSLSAMVLGTGHSIRSGASIVLLSSLSIAEVIFLCFDLSNTALYISQLALFLCIQLTIHQANIRSSANEWWTILTIVISLGISILPLVDLI